MVDAVRPESDTARRFTTLVARWLSHSSSEAELNEMKIWLSLWQSNDQALGPVLQSNALLKEVIPLSQTLQSVAAAGLQALEYLGKDGRAPAGWRTQQLNMLQQAKKAQAELLLMIVPAVEKLVTATTPQ